MAYICILQNNSIGDFLVINIFEPKYIKKYK